MKKVYSSDSVPMAWHVRNVLEQHEIPTTIKNDNLYSIAGEVPITECLPEVWVNNVLDFDRAELIIKEVQATSDEEGGGWKEDWQCENCGEFNGVVFEICWNCQQGIQSKVDLTR
jgi:hypothetical protein|tara:strand:+ start:1158 stop:1502 length:345 start_codon:yes stop_codon:yes gene_type:complete